MREAIKKFHSRRRLIDDSLSQQFQSFRCCVNEGVVTYRLSRVCTQATSEINREIPGRDKPASDYMMVAMVDQQHQYLRTLVC